ncbi:hypothetical protein CALVIDRAFT_596795 [Calocera viscosa TUFC12733]|uniref:F-box domain-containing protein n=1 Tax=Calocera viscosa (strain TUFC12733) TaxID=1330018 RepID=A0A167NYK7_CALVF|nr:hypothetical protein CALVIDRAFT_596795 [Calocera viscosa TUFC12733]
MSSNSGVPPLYPVPLLPDTFQRSDKTDPPAADGAPPASPVAPTSPLHPDSLTPRPITTMHRALGIVEIVSAIVLHLDRPDLAALARTSRLHLSMAVPRLWEAVTPAGALSLLRMLDSEMDEFSLCATPQQSDRFKLYAQHIRLAAISANNPRASPSFGPLPDLDLDESQLTILRRCFPKLWTFSVNLSQSTILRLASAFITPTMTCLSMTVNDVHDPQVIESFVSFIEHIKAVNPPLIKVGFGVGVLSQCPPPVFAAAQSLMRQMRGATDIFIFDSNLGYALMKEFQQRLKSVIILSQGLHMLPPNDHCGLSMCQLKKLELAISAHELIAVVFRLHAPLLQYLDITCHIICNEWCGPATVCLVLTTMDLASLEQLCIKIQEIDDVLEISTQVVEFKHFGAVSAFPLLKKFVFRFYSRCPLALGDTDIIKMARAWPALEVFTVDWRLTSETLTPLSGLHRDDEDRGGPGGLVAPGDLTIHCLSSLKEHCPHLRSIWFKHLTCSEADELDTVEWKASPGRVDLYVGASYLRTTNVSSAYAYLRSLWDDLQLEWGEENSSGMQWARVAERFKSPHV